MNKDVRALKYDFFKLSQQNASKEYCTCHKMTSDTSFTTVHTNIIMYMQLYILVYIINIIFKIYYKVN